MVDAAQSDDRLPHLFLGVFLPLHLLAPVVGGDGQEDEHRHQHRTSHHEPEYELCLPLEPPTKKISRDVGILRAVTPDQVATVISRHPDDRLSEPSRRVLRTRLGETGEREGHILCSVAIPFEVNGPRRAIATDLADRLQQLRAVVRVAACIQSDRERGDSVVRVGREVAGRLGEAAGWNVEIEVIGFAVGRREGGPRVCEAAEAAGGRGVCLKG